MEIGQEPIILVLASIITSIALGVYVGDSKWPENRRALLRCGKELYATSFEEKPTKTARCLGCNHIFRNIELPNGRHAKSVSREMSVSLRQAVQSYVAAGGRSVLPKVTTPFFK